MEQATGDTSLANPACVMGLSENGQQAKDSCDSNESREHTYSGKSERLQTRNRALETVEDDVQDFKDHQNCSQVHVGIADKGGCITDLASRLALNGKAGMLGEERTSELIATGAVYVNGQDKHVSTRRSLQPVILIRSIYFCPLPHVVYLLCASLVLS